MFGEKEMANEIINSLVRNFEIYMKNFSDRLKINNVFNEFENKARDDLMNLVKLSNIRYKSVKSGNSLESVLKKQTPVYAQIINNVLAEDLYKSPDIISEKKKFKNLNNKTTYNELNSLRLKIKETTKVLNADDNKSRPFGARKGKLKSIKSKIKNEITNSNKMWSTDKNLSQAKINLEQILI